MWIFRTLPRPVPTSLMGDLNCPSPLCTPRSGCGRLSLWHGGHRGLGHQRCALWHHAGQCAQPGGGAARWTAASYRRPGPPLPVSACCAPPDSEPVPAGGRCTPLDPPQFQMLDRTPSLHTGSLQLATTSPVSSWVLRGPWGSSQPPPCACTLHLRLRWPLPVRSPVSRLQWTAPFRFSRLRCPWPVSVSSWA